MPFNIETAVSRVFAAVAAFASLSLATDAFTSKIPAEIYGMESELRADGTFLIGGPTYIFDRVMGAGGVHSESELWSPEKLRDRLLLNRYMSTLAWNPVSPSIWLKTGNELGDMIYQDYTTQYADRPLNRTPILEGGFRSPSFKGFWATAQFLQDDHFSQMTKNSRKYTTDDEFALFGENWPLQSSVYGGLGYTNSVVNASVIAGEEYLWLYSETSRWIPVHYKPRVEGRIDAFGASLTVAYENAEYQDKPRREKGERKELNGSLYYKCGACREGIFQASAGLAFRAVDDSGHVYTELEEDRVFWPFIQLRIQPTARLFADAMFGINERDWMVQDSIQFSAPTPKNLGTLVGVKNISATRLNPLADTKEFYGDRTIDLIADGQMSLVQAYAAFADTVKSGENSLAVGARGSVWAEYGAETFEAESYSTGYKYRDSHYDLRYGNVSRINSWIKGVTGELWLGARYRKLAEFKATAGFERIDGEIVKAEVTPAEFYVGFAADWLIRKSLKVSHSIHYRSDAKWNLRSEDPMVVKGDWYWDASFEQQFPKYGIYLTATLMHVLADDAIEVLNSGYNGTRFICSIKKTF